MSKINLPEFTLGSKYTKSLFGTFGNIAKNDFLLPKTLMNVRKGLTLVIVQV